ncbi:MAG: cyclase family protein [Acidimicrobiales bacterium]
MALSEEVRELASKVSNWGRWGDDDQLGCGNLLTPEAATRGAGCVRTGKRFSLAVDLKADGIQVGQPAGRYNAMLSFTSLNERDRMAPGIWEGSDDMFTMSTCAGTHIDSLSHISYDGLLYGGRPQSSIRAQGGATWCGAEHLPTIVTRGILLDIPRLLGVDRVDPGHAVTATELDGALAATGLTVEAGDVICIRTGDIGWYLDGDRRRYAVGVDWKTVGLGFSCVEWFADRDVAGAFVDSYTYEVMPPESGNWDDLLAVHMVQLRDMGLLQGQNWNFEDLAADCAADGVSEFLLVAAPEPIVGATSAPVVPVATK